jgi:ribokinase
VVGHVEWAEVAHLDRLPAAGEIAQAEDFWEDVGGGGAIAAVQLARLAGECLFLTALADDPLGRRSKQRLEEHGVRVEAAVRPGSQRRAFVQVDAEGERTITITGERLGPRRDDALPWHELDSADAVYLTAGDAGAVRAARAASALVATVRARAALRDAGVRLDLLVASANDPGEAYEPGELNPPPRFVARSNGAAGGTVTADEGQIEHWRAAALPGPPVDSYGAGDSFAAGVTFGLAEGRELADAIAIGARCGAAVIAGRGPYEGQLRSADA